MPQPDKQQIEAMFKHSLNGLKQRNALKKPVTSVKLAEELIAAALEAGATQQDDAEISNLQVSLTDGAAEFSAQIKVKGRAWPPRPPIDTRVSFKANCISHEEGGACGTIGMTIEQPLEFSSKFADLLAGLFGKLLKGLPIPLDDLRRKDARIKIDFADMLKDGPPDVAKHAESLLLLGLKIADGKAVVELGFQ
ncbi:MAG: hypothetical protein V3V10_08475 [Planctomycetota bacterium]